MKVRFMLIAGLMALFACDQNRRYEQTVDMTNGVWLHSSTTPFKFSIADTASTYNVYCDLRNTNEYPFSRIFIHYSLTDSLGTHQKKQLISAWLFNPKDGTPTGKSGIGDIFSHRLRLLKDYKFPVNGSYTIDLIHEMRPDTLQGIVSVGLRVEKAQP